MRFTACCALHDMDKALYKIDHFIVLGLRKSTKCVGFEQKHC